MRDFKLTSAHDLDLTGSDLSIIEDGAEVAQSWKIRMFWLVGEWFYNATLGMPWLTKIFRDTASDVAKRQYIVDCTLGTDGVRSITSMKQSTTGHDGTLALDIETVYNTKEVLSL